VSLLAAVGGAYLFVTGGYLPGGADVPPPGLEKWAAHRSLHASIAREVPAGQKNPLPATATNLEAGIKLYGQHCAVCHGAADAKPSVIAKGVYWDAPQLAKDGVEDDPPGVTFWKLKHGIRFTGMPTFGSLSDDQLWQITLFLEQMDKLPPGPKAAWERLPSAG
jgi:thiosulfate dehydrogenase